MKGSYLHRFPDMYQMTLAWLIKYGVLFHGINVKGAIVIDEN